nr:MAG TPA: hypothetical protein [Caudoviricetes sp.]
MRFRSISCPHIKHPPSYFKSLLLYTKNNHIQRLLGNTQIDKL